MTIELDDESYIVGVWFSSNPITGNNWLACVIRDPDHPNKYKGWSRFRYVKDYNVFDSKDKKSWTSFTSSENTTDDEMIEVMDLTQNEIEEGYPDKDKIIVKDGLAKLMELSKGKSWMFFKEEPTHQT